MFDYLKSWFDRHFSDPRVNLLALLLVGVTVVVIFTSKILMPIFIAVVIAYLLEGLVGLLTERKVPRLVAVVVVFVLFLAVFLIILLAGIPAMYRQLALLLQELPAMIAQAQQVLLLLPERYPNIFSELQVRELTGNFRTETNRFAQWLLSYSLSSIPTLFILIIYAVIVPVAVFFCLKDKNTILAWFAGYLPSEKELVQQVWKETNQQIANYIRGKFWEILIVGVVTYAVFSLLGLNFAFLLSVLVGFSVLIPYIGATLVTFPIALIAFFQWGMGPEFAYVLIAYGVIQLLDANVLVPILFSRVVNLHPLAIIVAVLFFGGIWGFWGVFFAIPLATLIKAVLSAWPRREILVKEI